MIDTKSNAGLMQWIIIKYNAKTNIGNYCRPMQSIM